MSNGPECRAGDHDRNRAEAAKLVRLLNEKAFDEFARAAGVARGVNDIVVKLSSEEHPAQITINIDGGDSKWDLLHRTDLSYATLDNSTLLKANLNGTILRHASLDHCKLDGSELMYAELDEARLNRARLHDVDFNNARLVNARCEHADFRDAKMDEADLKGAILVGTIGLWGPAKATTGQCLRADEAVYSNDPFVWSALRWSHDLRLVGVSYISFVVGILYATMSRPVNYAIRSIRDWSASASREFPAIGWLEHLPSLPTSAFFAIQLVALLFVAIGTTIYRGRCPEFVQLYSETEWIVEKGQSRVEYRAASASMKWWRWAAWMFIGTGSLYTVLYLGWRLLVAVTYLFGF